MPCTACCLRCNKHKLFQAGRLTCACACVPPLECVASGRCARCSACCVKHAAMAPDQAMPYTCPHSTLSSSRTASTIVAVASPLRSQHPSHSYGSGVGTMQQTTVKRDRLYRLHRCTYTTAPASPSHSVNKCICLITHLCWPRIPRTQHVADLVTCCAPHGALP